MNKSAARREGSNPLAAQPRRSLGFGWLAAAVLIGLAGCSSGPQKPEPAALAPLVALSPARLVWSAQIGVTERPLVASAQGGRLVVASSSGTVAAFDTESGREIWRVAIGLALSAGVGSDGQTVALTTVDNEVVALADGKVLWRQKLGARTFTPPLVAGRRVFVLGADRRVSAFDAATGTRLWSQSSRSTDALVLQQAGVLTAVGDTLVAGQSGRLSGLNPLNGGTRWEAPIATARGTNEIERLIDLVGPVSRVGASVCARAYQSAVGCADASSGALVWSRPAAGSEGVHGDDSQLYGTESNGLVIAWRRGSGDVAWSTDRLLHRGLTAPLAAGRSVAIGDASGFVHLLSRQDGSILNRLSTDGSAVIAAPVLSGSTLIAVTRNGGVYAWRPE